MVIIPGKQLAKLHMKILWEPFSSHFLSTPFVRLSTRPQFYRYVIASVVFTLLFAQCFSHDLTTDKPDDNVNATQTKWLNDNRSYALAEASDARVVISKRQSPTKISSSLPSNQVSTRSDGTTASVSMSATPRTITNYLEKSTLYTSHGDSLTTFSPSSMKLATANGIHHPIPVNNVLILIQTQKNIQLNLVRDQFHQFTDKFGVKLQNITIDFDAIDGKWALAILYLFFPSIFCVGGCFSTSVASFTHNVCNLTSDRCVLHGSVVLLKRKQHWRATSFNLILNRLTAFQQ